MFNSTILDVAVGLIFTYLLLALICTTINEWIAGLFGRRPKTLQAAVRSLLNAPPDGTYDVRLSDIADVTRLAERIKAAESKQGTSGAPVNIAEYLHSLLPASVDLDTANDESKRPALVDALVQVLNQAIHDPALFKKVDFKNAASSREALAAAEQNRDAGAWPRLNRNLLQSAFPGWIKALSDAFYEHPLIRALTKGADRCHPSYIPARTFALTILDIIAKDPAKSLEYNELKQGIASLPDSDVRTALLAGLRDTAETVEGVQRTIEQWYEDAMDRAIGWYKRRTQVLTFFVALVLSVGTNADTFHIMNRLWKDSDLRAAGVRLAEQRTTPDQAKAGVPAASTGGGGGQTSASEQAFLSQLMNWNEEQAMLSHSSAGNWLLWLLQTHLLGWLFTTVAVSLGAPFWFDLLKKVMDVRAAGKNPDEKSRPPAKPEQQRTKPGVPGQNSAPA